jgi:oligosaccharide repeat unit polymerase
MMLLSTLRLWGIESTASLTYGEVIGFRYNNLLPFLINELAATIYGYSALNFQNFSNFVGAHPDNSLHLGTSMFRPLLSFLMQGDIADSMIPSRSEWHYVSEAATVGTFLRELYMEGGALLCILGSAIYALLVNVIYVQFRRRRSVTWLFVYIVFLFPWTWLFFQNAFSVLQFYIDAFYVLAISLASALLRVVISSKRGIAAGTHRY